MLYVVLKLRYYLRSLEVGVILTTSPEKATPLC